MLGFSDENKIQLFEDENQKSNKLIIGESLVWKIDDEVEKEIDKVMAFRDSLRGVYIPNATAQPPPDNPPIFEENIKPKDVFYNSKKEKTKLSFSNKGYLIAHKKADINAGFNSMYIYSNVVQHQAVGNAYAQLLRNIPVTENVKWGEAVHLSFDKPHLIPVHSRNFDTIEIDIRDDTGKKIPFESGRVIIKLVFKKYD